MNSIKTGYLSAIICCLKNIISNNLIPNYDFTNLSIITYDEENLSVFSLRSNRVEKLKVASKATKITFNEFYKNIIYEEATKNFDKYDINVNFSNISLKNIKNLSIFNGNNEKYSSNDFFIPIPQKHLIVNIEDNRNEIIKCLDNLESEANITANNYNYNKIKSNAVEYVNNLFLHSIYFATKIFNNLGAKIMCFNSSAIEINEDIKQINSLLGNKLFDINNLNYNYNINEIISSFANKLNQEKFSIFIYQVNNEISVSYYF